MGMYFRFVLDDTDNEKQVDPWLKTPPPQKREAPGNQGHPKLNTKMNSTHITMGGLSDVLCSFNSSLLL